MTWAPALAWTALALIALCALVVVLEIRRIRHDALYIRRSAIDRSYRTGQFAVPDSLRDHK